MEITSIRPESPAIVTMNIDINRDLRAQLRASASLRHMTMPALLHEILCRGLDRMDLIDRGPPEARSS